jgi:hypothetical protein
MDCIAKGYLEKLNLSSFCLVLAMILMFHFIAKFIPIGIFLVKKNYVFNSVCMILSMRFIQFVSGARSPVVLESNIPPSTSAINSAANAFGSTVDFISFLATPSLRMLTIFFFHALIPCAALSLSSGCVSSASVEVLRIGQPP